MKRGLWFLTTSSLFHRAMATATSTASAPTPARVAIIGGSLGGLAAANALQSLRDPVTKEPLWKVTVFERAPGPMHQKGSGLGFVHVPAWEALRGGVPMMRRRQRASRHQGSFYYGDLWKFLYEGLEPTTVQFNQQIDTLKIASQNDDTTCENEESSRSEAASLGPKVQIMDNFYDLVLLCDGGFSSFRRYVSSMDEKPKYAGYVVWRGSLSEKDLPQDHVPWIQEGIFKSGIYDTIVLKMAKDSGENMWTMGSFIATPEEELIEYGWDGKNLESGKDRQVEDEVNRNNKRFEAPDWFLEHFQKEFANVPGLVSLIEHMLAKGEIRAHPQYEFGATKVREGRILLLGDAAHMASPRTAVGAHTAILDALALQHSFSRHPHNLDRAMDVYQDSGVERAQELYARTREVSRQFVAAESRQR